MTTFTFEFSATMPRESGMVGGHFVTGELKAIPEDLPDAVAKIVRGACQGWDFEGETTVKFTLKPNG